MRSQIKISERFSLNVYQDVFIAKTVFDKLSKKDEEISMKGYIQKIVMDKFGFLMFSEKQVNIFRLNFLCTFFVAW
jgi:hypothetical protein